MLMYSGPHHTNIGNRELSQTLTAVARLWGHRPIGPSDVSSHRNSRTRAAISLFLVDARRVANAFDPSVRSSILDIVQQLSAFASIPLRLGAPRSISVALKAVRS